MKHLVSLKERKEKLEKLLDTIDVARRSVHLQEREDLTKVLEKFFTAEEGDVVECTHSGVYVSKEGFDKYDSFITIYVDDSWDENDSKVHSKLYINNSSFKTEAIGEWIVERFERQAHYARIAVDFQDDILAEMNQITEAANQKINDITIPAIDLRKESRKIQEEIDAIEKETRLKALMSEEGLEIKGTQRERWGSTYTQFPDLQVKWDWTLYSIRGLRIDKMSASGKSADITVKVKRDRWNQDGSVLRDQIVEEQVERVRMDNIETFLRQNNIAI